MMQIKRYEAKDMTSALRLIKNELGPDAVILSARSLKKENKLLGMVKSVGVEVTAAVDTYHHAVESKGAAFTGALSAYRHYAQNGKSGRRDVRRVVGRSRKPRKGSKAPHSAENDILTAADGVLSAVFEHLLSQEVKRELAADIVARLNQRHAQTRFDTTDTIIAETVNILQDKLQPVKANVPVRSGARIVVVVGPTGVGKTTTLAKLAARNAIEQHQSVALISLDADRIGATAELKVYAQAIGIPLKTAANPAAFRAAIDPFKDFDLILVDTPGLNPADPVEIDALKACMAGIDHLEIHLALSATAKKIELDNILKRLNELTVAGLIFTKLDESCTYGNLINLLNGHPLPLSYLTDGRQVPTAIEEGSLEKIVRLLLSDLTCRTPVSNTPTKDASVAGTESHFIEHRFVANKNSDVFHCSDCKWTQKIKSKNLITFSSAETARMQQFVPCRDCQPQKSEPFQMGVAATRDSVRISNTS
jgi:flagellar biosynthesis protein FlhF